MSIKSCCFKTLVRPTTHDETSHSRAIEPPASRERSDGIAFPIFFSVSIRTADDFCGGLFGGDDERFVESRGRPGTDVAEAAAPIVDRLAQRPVRVLPVMNWISSGDVGVRITN